MTLGIQLHGLRAPRDRALGNGDDTFFIDSTPVGVDAVAATRRRAAAAERDNDVDQHRAHRRPDHDRRPAAATTSSASTTTQRRPPDLPRTASAALLTLHGQAGGDLYEIGLSGTASPASPTTTLIDVDDQSPAGDIGVNQLRIFGTNEADFFLLRANLRRSGTAASVVGLPGRRRTACRCRAASSSASTTTARSTAACRSSAATATTPSCSTTTSRRRRSSATPATTRSRSARSSSRRATARTRTTASPRSTTSRRR